MQKALRFACRARYMFLRKPSLSFVLSLLMSFFISCANDPSAGYLDWTPGTDRKTGAKTDILAHMIFSDDQDLLGRAAPGSKRFQIAIKNASSQDLNECVITMDDRYRAALKDRYLGNPFGGSRLPKGEKISILFDYDASTNYFIFIDKDINVDWRQIPAEDLAWRMMGHSRVPEKLTLQHASGIIDWDLTQAKNHPAKKGKQ
jgi:hypothetical protein